MTKTFSTLIAALAITASLAAFSAPAQAFIWGGDGPSQTRISGSDVGSGGVSTMDLGSGR